MPQFWLYYIRVRMDVSANYREGLYKIIREPLGVIAVVVGEFAIYYTRARLTRLQTESPAHFVLTLSLSTSQNFEAKFLGSTKCERV